MADDVSDQWFKEADARKKVAKEANSLKRWNHADPAKILTNPSTNAGPNTRFIIKIGLSHMQEDSAAELVKRLNEVMKEQSQQAQSNDWNVKFILEDPEIQTYRRAIAEFRLFKTAKECLSMLEQNGMRVNQDTQAELEDFGKKHDAWSQRRQEQGFISRWFSRSDPEPEMKRQEITIKANYAEGDKYEEGPDGKLKKRDEGSRSEDADKPGRAQREALEKRRKERNEGKGGRGQKE